MSILDEAVRREPWEGVGGRSGATFEQITLQDGSQLIVKHVSPETDYLMRATHDDGRLPFLWRQGIFAQLPSVIDTGMVAVEEEANGWLIAMRDVGVSLLGDERVLTRQESRRVLGAVHQMHTANRGKRLPHLCDPRDRLRLMSRAQMAAEEREAYPFGIASVVRRGWERFEEAVPRDIADVIFAIHADPNPLAKRTEGRPSTFVHGDLRLANLGLTPDKVLLLDWGSTCSYAPSASEFAWYLIISASRIDATREEVVADFKAIEGEQFDQEALDLAYIAALAILGWNKAFDMFDNPDENIRGREKSDLDWWVATVRKALDSWSPF